MDHSALSGFLNDGNPSLGFGVGKLLLVDLRVKGFHMLLDLAFHIVKLWSTK